jgi:hypothetical protein
MRPHYFLLHRMKPSVNGKNYKIFNASFLLLVSFLNNWHNFCVFTKGPLLLLKVVFIYVHLFWGRNSLVGSAPRFTAWMDCTSNRCLRKFSHFQKLPHWLWGSFSFHLNGHWKYFTLVKRPERDAGQSPPSAAEVETTWSCICIPPLYFHGIQGTTLHHLFISLYENWTHSGHNAVSV